MEEDRVGDKWGRGRDAGVRCENTQEGIKKLQE